jgi:hypothetical protein
MQCVPLCLNPGLGIDLKRAPAVGVSHQLLYHLHVFPIRHQQAGKAVKGVPSYVLSDPGSQGCRASHVRASYPASKGFYREYEGLQTTNHQTVCRGCLVSRTRARRQRSGPWAQFARGLGLAIANDIQIDRAPHIDLQFIEINVAPFQGKEFTAAQSAGCIEQHHHTKAAIQLRK